MPMARERMACVYCLSVPLTSRPCCCGVLPSPDSPPVLRRLQNQGPSSGLGGREEQRLALADAWKGWAFVEMHGTKGKEAGGLGPRGLGALHPGATCRHSTLLCGSALLPRTGSLLSSLSQEGIRLAQPPTAFSVWAAPGPPVCINQPPWSRCCLPPGGGGRVVGTECGYLRPTLSQGDGQAGFVEEPGTSAPDPSPRPVTFFVAHTR